MSLFSNTRATGLPARARKSFLVEKHLVRHGGQSQHPHAEIPQLLAHGPWLDPRGASRPSCRQAGGRRARWMRCGPRWAASECNRSAIPEGPPRHRRASRLSECVAKAWMAAAPIGLLGHIRSDGVERLGLSSANIGQAVHGRVADDPLGPRPTQFDCDTWCGGRLVGFSPDPRRAGCRGRQR